MVKKPLGFSKSNFELGCCEFIIYYYYYYLYINSHSPTPGFSKTSFVYLVVFTLEWLVKCITVWPNTYNNIILCVDVSKAVHWLSISAILAIQYYGAAQAVNSYRCIDTFCDLPMWCIPLVFCCIGELKHAHFARGTPNNSVTFFKHLYFALGPIHLG